MNFTHQPSADASSCSRITLASITEPRGENEYSRGEKPLLSLLQQPIYQIKQVIYRVPNCQPNSCINVSRQHMQRFHQPLNSPVEVQWLYSGMEVRHHSLSARSGTAHMHSQQGLWKSSNCSEPPIFIYYSVLNNRTKLVFGFHEID